MTQEGIPFNEHQPPLFPGILLRPRFDGIISHFEATKPTKTPGDENWLYIEFYGKNGQYQELRRLLGSYVKGHEINKEFFSWMVKQCCQDTKG